MDWTCNSDETVKKGVQNLDGRIPCGEATCNIGTYEYQRIMLRWMRGI
jgi:hypothetical protein